MTPASGRAAPDVARRWFGVRSVVSFPADEAYEERITLWQAAGLEDAIALAEAESLGYAQQLGAVDTGVYQAYAVDGDPAVGAEVFSLVRTSPLEPDAYVDAFFDTGTERQRLL